VLCVQGVCCASVLDAAGLCCPSGGVDECGVCDGDGTSCSLHLRLMLQVPQGMNITGAGTAWLGGIGGSTLASTQLLTWTQSVLQQAFSHSSQETTDLLLLQPGQVVAKWAEHGAAGGTIRASINPPATRHLSSVVSTDDTLCGAGVHTNSKEAASMQDCSSDQPDVQCLARQPSVEAVQGGPSCDKSSGNRDQGVQGAARLLQQASSTVSTEAPVVQLDVALNPSNVLQISRTAQANLAGTVTSRGQMGAGLLGVGQLLATGLEQQALNSSSSGPAGGGDGGQGGSAGPQLLRVMLVQRVGVCGNGLCEVGERELRNSEGGILQEAVTPCAQVGG